MDNQSERKQAHRTQDFPVRLQGSSEDADEQGPKPKHRQGGAMRRCNEPLHEGPVARCRTQICDGDTKRYECKRHPKQHGT